ncbi:MAG: LLM class flavin-dependent oxidoreductase [Hyphomicrobiaceae bacterium]
MLTYAFRLPPGPDTVAQAVLAEQLGYESVWCPEIPAFGHDIWVTLARIAENTSRIGIGASVLIPSYRHPMAQASAIATLEALAPGRVRAGFGTGFTGRAGMGKRPLTLAYMRRHIEQVRGLLRGDVVDIDGGLAQIIASEGQLPARPIDVPILLASQGPKGRQLASEIADGLIALGGAAHGFETCLVSTNGTVLDDSEDMSSPRVRAAVQPIIALAYHFKFTNDPDNVGDLPSGEEWMASVLNVPEAVRHLSVHRGHNLDVSNGHDHLVDVSAAKEVTFTGTRDELRARLDALEAAGATGVILGTSGVDVERELRAYAEVAGL